MSRRAVRVRVSRQANKQARRQAHTCRRASLTLCLRVMNPNCFSTFTIATIPLPFVDGAGLTSVTADARMCLRLFRFTKIVNSTSSP